MPPLEYFVMFAIVIKIIAMISMLPDSHFLQHCETLDYHNIRNDTVRCIESKKLIPWIVCDRMIKIYKTP